jgi:hypothetical protein
MTIDEQFRDHISDEAYNTYNSIIRKQIACVSPDYLEAFDECFGGFSIYPNNLFITKWEHFSDYCEWLFGIILGIIDVEKLDRYDGYSRRVVGFYAERLFTVWLLKHNYRIKELYCYWESLA